MNLLKNIATIGSGQNAPQEESEYSVLGKTFIKVSNLDDIIQDQNESRACKITADAINKNKLKLYPKYTIIFAKSGLSCVKNRVYLTKDDSYIVNHLCTISNIKNDYYPKWLLYFIKNYDVTKLIHDESYPSISLKDIGKIEIPEVGLNIQILISNQLDFIIETINKKLVQLNQLNELVKSRFIEMFGDPNFNDKNWDRLQIRDIGECVAGATPSTKVNEYWENGTISWLSSGEVHKRRIYSTDSKITQSGYDHASTKMVPAHTVLLAMAGQGKTRGTAAMAEIPLCTNQSICSIVNNEKINPEYLMEYLTLEYNELRSASNGGEGRGGLNLKIIGDFPINVPPINLQNEYAEFIKQIDKSKFVCYSKYFLWLNLTFVSSTIAYSNVVSILE